jgi:predicted ATP-dependent endonuclease of OLD family
VWFSKIQADRGSNYILLLDEPGLNLHASAQNDLLRFIEKLSDDYQIIYTTHSPFMIDSLKLHRVRTIFDSEKGSKISDAIQEKDPDTLFPLQAALGYDIAQNLFISKNNLLVEGPADLLYLSIMSNILESKGRTGLDQKITIVPTGGLDKVATFISLLRGSKLNIVCLLDTFNDAKGKQRIDDLIRLKIIKDRNIKYFNEFVSTVNNKADIEDLFRKEEYLSFFNSAHPKYKDISITDINASIPNIIIQINTYLNIDKFNHYGPAYEFAKKRDIETCLSEDTFNIFEAMFKNINIMF